MIDKRPQPSGNVYCVDVEGVAVHKYGAHIFHTNDEDVWKSCPAAAACSVPRRTVHVMRDSNRIPIGTGFGSLVYVEDMGIGSVDRRDDCSGDADVREIYDSGRVFVDSG